MRESRTSGSVRGGRGNPVPYRYNRHLQRRGDPAKEHNCLDLTAAH